MNITTQSTTPNNTQFGICNIKSYVSRIRLVMHDACVLSVSMGNSLGDKNVLRLEQNELYFWKRNTGAISND